MKDRTPPLSTPRPAYLSPIAVCSSLFAAGCIVERIDAIIADRGVTECSSSTDQSSGDIIGSTDTSTGTTDTSANDSSTTDSSTSSGETTVQGSQSGSSSTGPASSCGNGIVETGETCDDGNAIPGDGCQECAKDSVMFITSEVYQGFALGGLYGADQRCQSLAAKAGLEEFLTFKAWLSTPTMSVAERMRHSRGRYVLVNGAVVAQDWESLTSGTIENPIVVDENSHSQDTRAWTGTLANGQAAPGSEFCEDWSDDSGLLKFGGTGLSVNTDATWSFFDNAPCDSELRLYCIEQAELLSP
jgi:cysteine-rich repeat protein